MTQQIPKGPLRFAWFVSRPYRGWLALAVFFIAISTVAHSGTSYVLKLIIDSATAYGEGVGTLTGVMLVMLAYPGIVLVETLSYRGTGIALHYITARIRTRAYRVLFDHLSLHSAGYFSDRFAGALASKVNIVGGNMSRIANDVIWSYLWLIISISISFVLMYSASSLLAYIFLGVAAVMIPINLLITGPQMKLAEERSRTMNVLRGQIVDTITNILAVRHYARRSHELTRLDGSILDHQEADIKADVHGEKVLLINNVLILFFISGLIYAAFWLWSQGSISLGEFVMAATLSITVIWGLSRIGQTINEFLATYGETKSSLEEILRDHDITDVPDAKELTVSSGAIEFAEVTFTYPGAEQKTFEKLNLSIRGGEKVGLVGSSGSGKSSLVRVLLREHDLEGGEIRIDGQNIQHMTQDSVREAIAVVPQESLLFHRSLHENIAYGKPEATRDEVEEASRKAQIHEFIETLPEGYETLVGERGVKLSGGQRQRVAIARAILKNAPILILDEATSSLDSESEVKIQQALHELIHGKTVIAVAHRLSTIKEMDRIVVLEDGKVVEEGTHDELLALIDGVYARLWTHQAGGFLPS